MIMTPKEVCWMSLKDQGFFAKYKSYEEYQDSYKKESKVEITLSKAMMKANEIQRLKVAYDPPPTDPEELKEYNKRKGIKPTEEIKKIKKIEF